MTDRRPQPGDIWCNGNGLAVKVTWVGWSERDRGGDTYVLFSLGDIGGSDMERPLARFRRYWRPLVITSLRVYRYTPAG